MKINNAIIKAIFIITCFISVQQIFAQVTFKTHTIAGGDYWFHSPRFIHVADLDGDDDMDVLSSSTGDHNVTWYENDGSQNFTRHIIDDVADQPFSVKAADLDGDTDIDVIAASFMGDKILWYENDREEDFTEHILAYGERTAMYVSIADVDGDSDMDVLSVSSHRAKVSWHENLGSTGIYDDKSIIPVSNRLENNYPNPFNPFTIIPYTVKTADHVNLTVYDVLGREIKIIVDKFQRADKYEVRFNGHNLPSGIYIYKLKIGNGIIATWKKILLR